MLQHSSLRGAAAGRLLRPLALQESYHTCRPRNTLRPNALTRPCGVSYYANEVDSNGPKAGDVLRFYLPVLLHRLRDRTQAETRVRLRSRMEGLSDSSGVAGRWNGRGGISAGNGPGNEANDVGTNRRF